MSHSSSIIVNHYPVQTTSTEIGDIAPLSDWLALFDEPLQDVGLSSLGKVVPNLFHARGVIIIQPRHLNERKVMSIPRISAPGLP